MPNLLVAFLLVCFSTASLAQDTPYSQVNPFIGTQTSALLDNGNVTPAASRPFGMLSWGPDPASGGIYRYEEPVTRGFSLIHLSGPGCGAYGDVPIFPMLGMPAQPAPTLPLSYQSAYQHKDEVAQPGYYAVTLASGITVRLAAALRSGIAEITYPASQDPHTLLLDLSRNLNQTYDAHVQMEGTYVSGSVTGGAFCGLRNRYTVFFSLRVEEIPQKTGTFDERGLAQRTSADGARVGSYLQFSPSVKTLHVKVGLSFVSAAKAEQNLASEIPGWNLEEIRTQARQAWDEVLSHAVVNGGNPAERKVFYTAMYHALLEPNIYSDADGEYLGFDGKTHQRKNGVEYANFSGWDIYRSQVQLITMLFPKVGSDIAQSLVDIAEQGGGLPIWPLANDESSCMVGDPSDLIIASIYAFGGRDFDTHAALKAMVRGADDPATHIRLYPERPSLAAYLKDGYVPETHDQRGSASVTLEYENADFAIAQFAAALGEKSTADRFQARAVQWRKLFDSEAHYIRPRNADGQFLPNFKPENYDGFVEGNSAQYTWMIPYDVPALIKAIGGNDVVNKRLDDYFSQYGSYQLNHGPYFYIANEPSFGNPWIYNWSGEPWRADAVVRKTLHDLFNDTPAGLPGNDDLGATSAWIVFAQLGMYPEIPAVAGFTLNSPMFPGATLMLGSHKLSITASGAPDQLYLRDAVLEGKTIHDRWISWSALQGVQQLTFKLQAEPDRAASAIAPQTGLAE